MATRWIRTEGTIWEELDGETVLVQAHTRRAWSLNATAGYLWRCCDGGASLEQVARRLARAGRCEFQMVYAELRSLCSEMQTAGLLQPAAAGSGGAALRNFDGVSRSFEGGYLTPSLRSHGFGAGPRHRPGPRGLSGGPG